MFEKDPCLTTRDNPHSPLTIIQTLIREGATILDVGCNTGYLGKLLKKILVTSDGIDINEKALNIAKKYYRSVFKRNLYSPTLNLPKLKYDYIIFADLLEHLPRPDLLLKDAASYLKKGGEIIISIPNIARVEVRLQLLFGNFDYKDAGILSEDHLRHFTKKSAINMIEHCNLTVIKTIPTGLGHQIKLFPNLTAFQFIYICRLKSTVKIDKRSY